MNRYDTIVVGGGLAGLVGAISIAEGGRSVALISSGRSSLDYFSGSFELFDEGVEGVRRLSTPHPYATIGAERIEEYTERLKVIFASAGIPLKGSVERAEWRITPLGVLKRAWLTLEDFATLADVAEYGKVCVVGVEGYLDFNAEFVARPFRKGGVECRVVSAPYAKTDVANFAQRVKTLANDAELVLLPAMFAADELQTIREMVGARVMVVPTTSVSLSGRSVQRALRERLVALGGTLVESDRVAALDVEKNSVQRVHTAKGVTYKAENYLLATGSFFGGGVVATQKSVYEPLAGVDVDAAQERSEWTCEHILAEQPFENFGVVVNENLHPLVDGLAIDNLYAVGAILAGSDGVREGSGGGVALCSALRAAELILEK